MDIDSLPESLKGLVGNELESGERVRWVGQPVPRSTIPWIALFPFFFSIPWTLFSLFWMAMASGVMDPFRGFQGFGQVEPVRLVFSLFGVPFVLVGIGLMSSPYWIRRRLRRSAAGTAYLITDRRAIIFDSGYCGDSGLASVVGGVAQIARKGIHIRSYGPHKLGQVQRVQQEDGSGDVIFGEVLIESENNGQRQVMRSGFFSIPNVKDVEKLLNSLAETH